LSGITILFLISSILVKLARSFVALLASPSSLLRRPLEPGGKLSTFHLDKPVPVIWPISTEDKGASTSILSVILALPKKQYSLLYKRLAEYPSYEQFVMQEYFGPGSWPDGPLVFSKRFSFESKSSNLKRGPPGKKDTKIMALSKHDIALYPTESVIYVYHRDTIVSHAKQRGGWRNTRRYPIKEFTSKSMANLCHHIRNSVCTWRTVLFLAYKYDNFPTCGLDTKNHRYEEARFAPS